MLNESHALWRVSRSRSVFLNDAAALLGVSRRTVYYRIREGKLRTLRTRGGSQRVLIDSIESLLREGSRRRGGRRKRLLEAEALPLEVEALSRDPERPRGGIEATAVVAKGDLDHLAFDSRERRHEFVG